jgi:hypothetical protein
MNTFFTVVGIVAILVVCGTGALWALGFVEIHFTNLEDYP